MEKAPHSLKSCSWHLAPTSQATHPSILNERFLINFIVNTDKAKPNTPSNYDFKAELTQALGIAEGNSWENVGHELKALVNTASSYDGFGFYFVRKYLTERHSQSSSSNPMGGYSDDYDAPSLEEQKELVSDVEALKHAVELAAYANGDNEVINRNDPFHGCDVLPTIVVDQ